jgi:hypothetical protein
MLARVRIFCGLAAVKRMGVIGTSVYLFLQENFTRQYRATIQRAISVKIHNYPYQIGKIEVPHRQP